MLEKAEIMPPEEKKSEVEEFLGEIKGNENETDPFNEKAQVEAPVEGEKKEEEEVEPLKNRRHRRLETQLQAEREANIEQAAIIRTLKETDKFRSETGSDDLDAELARIYGTETPEQKQASQILQKAFHRYGEQAETRALEKYKALQDESAKEQRENETFIDSQFEEIEDEFNYDLTSNAPSARKARTELIDLVAKLSPKDSDGNIIEYADFGSAFEILQQSKTKDTRAKDLGSRSMVKSGASAPSKLESEAAERYLRDNGII